MLIDWFTVLAQAGNFLILVWLMKRYLYRPVLSAIDTREAATAWVATRAQALQADAVRERDDYAAKQAALEAARANLMQSAEQDALAERLRLLVAARAEASTLRTRLLGEVVREREALAQGLGQNMQREVFAVARKVLDDLGDAGLEAQMARRFASQMQLLDEAECARLRADLQVAGAAVTVRSALALGDDERASIGEALRTALGQAPNVQFELAPQLVCGIEVGVGGRKLAWSVDSYLVTLAEHVQKLLDDVPATPAPPAATGIDANGAP